MINNRLSIIQAAVEASVGIVCDRDPQKDTWWTLAYSVRDPFNGDDQIFDSGSFNIKAFVNGGLTFRDNQIAMDRSDLACGASGSPWFISAGQDPSPPGTPIRLRVPKGTIIHPAGCQLPDPPPLHQWNFISGNEE